MARAWLTAAVRRNEGVNKVYSAYEIRCVVKSEGGYWGGMFDPLGFLSYQPAPAAGPGTTFAPGQGHRNFSGM